MYKADAIAHFGGTQADIVRVLKDSKTPRSKGAVSLWKGLVPLVVAYELARLSRGKLKVDLSLYQAATNFKDSHVAA